MSHHRPHPVAPDCTVRGFSLLELLVAMVIIGLLAAYVAPRYFGQVGKAEVRAAKAQVEGLTKALDQYRLDTRTYPTTDQGLEALMKRPGELASWQGPYLQKAVPMDPWGRPYVYRSPVAEREYELLSLGRDGRAGGSGEDADITSW